MGSTSFQSICAMGDDVRFKVEVALAFECECCRKIKAMHKDTATTPMVRNRGGPMNNQFMFFLFQPAQALDARPLHGRRRRKRFLRGLRGSHHPPPFPTPSMHR